MQIKFVSINNFISQIKINDLDFLQSLFDLKVNWVMRSILKKINYRKSLTFTDNPADFVMAAKEIINDYKIAQDVYTKIKKVLDQVAEHKELYKVVITAGHEAAKRWPLNAEFEYRFELFLEELEYAAATRNLNKVWVRVTNELAGFKNIDFYSEENLAKEIVEIFMENPDSLYYPLGSYRKMNTVIRPMSFPETKEFIENNNLSKHFPEDQDQLFLYLFLNTSFIEQQKRAPLHNTQLQNYFDLIFIFYQIRNGVSLVELNTKRKDLIKNLLTSRDTDEQINKISEEMLAQIKNYLLAFRQRYQTDEQLREYLQDYTAGKNNYGLVENIHQLFGHTDQKAKTILVNDFKQILAEFEQDILFKLILTALFK